MLLYILYPRSYIVNKLTITDINFALCNKKFAKSEIILYEIITKTPIKVGLQYRKSNP